MKIEESIGSLLQAGTQLSSLQDILVSLQKQDPPIDSCFEMLEAWPNFSARVCVCMCEWKSVWAHVSRILPVRGKVGEGRMENTLGLAPLLLSIRQDWMAASKPVDQAADCMFAPGWTAGKYGPSLS